ncbi:TPA: class C sortase [Enterococcus faecium]|nr:class C sortase [Enterococcus faecium]HAR1794293.1 class C sortase [Enterococcus faecium]HAR1799632.1 class C sortase [Enterococcus faecium]HAR1803049.1 class C sortase [Enterococcus faecium]HAR1806022.1 class C sortase [Enterococcus faecium]
MNKSRIRILDIFMAIILVAGIGIFSYPFVEDSLNDLIIHYQKQASNKNSEEIKKQQEKMTKKNQQLAEQNVSPGIGSFNQAVDAKALKDLPSNAFFMEHMLGVIEIPKINVSLPIFDQTTEIFLQKGTSLLEGSSYPTGGKNTHAVLSGHRGLPEAKLFTDLPKLKKGDQFFIQINGKTLAYQVEKIQVVLPDEVDSLGIQKGRDLVTLLTCTPYMVNTHRLLVTGHRIPYQAKEAKKAIQGIDQWKKWKFFIWFIGILLGSIGLVWLLIAYLDSLAIAKRNYPLSFYVKNTNGRPIEGMVFSVKTLNGKHYITREKVPFVKASDEYGLVRFSDLKGGNYRLQHEELLLKIHVKHKHSKQFSMKLKKGRYKLRKEKEVYYLIEKE